MDTTFVGTFGMLALTGTLLYAVGDVLLLAGRVTLDEHSKIKPYTKFLSGAERMVAFSPRRMMWGALFGVFSTPLVLAGFWLVYQGLGGGNAWAAAAVFGLFGTASIIGTFVHGSFYYMGEYVHALNSVDEVSQPFIAGMIERHKKVLLITYAPLLGFVVVASIWFSALILQGGTRFPAWMAAVNPVIVTIVWMLSKRVLPQFVRDWTEGAGFNIAYLVFFACVTFTLWSH